MRKNKERKKNKKTEKKISEEQNGRKSGGQNSIIRKETNREGQKMLEEQRNLCRETIRPQIIEWK